MSRAILQSDGSLIIVVNDWCYVRRSTDGIYTCYDRRCLWKQEADRCEHVRWAREEEQQKAETEKQRQQHVLEVARAMVVQLEKKLGQEPKAEALVLDPKRKISVTE